MTNFRAINSCKKSKDIEGIEEHLQIKKIKLSLEYRH